MTSLSSLCLSPLSSARCRWPTSCFSRPSAIRVAHVIRLRSRLERPGRSHTSPNSTRSLKSTRAGTMSRTWSRADAGCCGAIGLSLSRLRPSCGYPSFVDYNPGAGRPVFGESPSETPRHAAHRLANRAVGVHYGANPEVTLLAVMSASTRCRPRGHASGAAGERRLTESGSCHSPALDPAKLAQALHKRGDHIALSRRRARAHESDGRQLARLLRAHRARPHRRRAAEQRDEIATFQLIEWHSVPLPAWAGFAGYRIDHNQSAHILNLVSRWPAPLRRDNRHG